MKVKRDQPNQKDGGCVADYRATRFCQPALPGRTEVCFESSARIYF